MPGPPRNLHLTVDEAAFVSSQESATRLPMRLTSTVAQLMQAAGDASNGQVPHNDPLRLQFIPRAAELVVRPEERADPLGESEHSPYPRLVHRYPDRILILVTDKCAVHCRYCFRTRFTGTAAGVISDGEIDDICGYLRSHPEIREIILSGGDGLMLSPRELDAVLSRTRAALRCTFRIATRVPVVEPGLMDARIPCLARFRPLWIVLQVNHVNELGPAACEAIEALLSAGISVVSQTVLLRGVNDDAGVLAALFVRLVELGVKPYYLFQMDLAQGTSHFRVDLNRALGIVTELRGRVSGLAMPVFAVDIPGGHGKVRLEESALAERHDHGYLIRAADGSLHEYPRGDL